MRDRRTILCAVFLAILFLPVRAVFAARDSGLEPITVRPGDTLWSISQKYLKDPTKWSEILKHNKLPTSDPTVALPGMTLKVPTVLIVEKYRAAKLVEAVRRVYSRAKGTADWQDVSKGKLLYHEDGLRTRKESWARVEFHEGSVLSVDPDSMVILKSPKKADHELFLNRGAVHATTARVATPSARIVPKGNDTKYTARVMSDLSTNVKVYKGKAEVQDTKGLKTVTVNAGQATNISLDGLPEVPVRMPDMNADLDANIALGNIRAPSAVSVVRTNLGTQAAPGVGNVSELAVDLQRLTIGMPVAAYHVQVSRNKNFSRLLFEKVYDAYEKIDLKNAGLTNGQYWVRIAIVDLLGDKGSFSQPKRYQVGAVGPTVPIVESDDVLFEVTRPAERESRVNYRKFRIRGRADSDLSVTINGKRVPKDEDGNFTLEVSLVKGENSYTISAVDLRGNDRTITRTITYAE